MLNDEEQVIVRDLLNELFYRRTYLDLPRILCKLQNKTLQRIQNSCICHTPASSYENVNCSINELAELNRNSCTDVVRAAANFFLEKDSLKQVCSTGKI